MEPSIDLRDPESRAWALRALTTPRPSRWRFVVPSPGCLTAMVVTLIVVLTFAGIFALGAWLGDLGALCAFFLVPIAATLVWTLVLGRRWDRLVTYAAEVRGGTADGYRLDPRMRDRDLGPSIALRDTATRAGTDRTLVEGIVRVRSAVHAPCSGEPCAAFRVSGTHGRVTLDDAGLGVFDIEVDGELRARVEGGEGCVELEVPRASKMTNGSEHLAAFLAPRSLAPGDATLELGEAVLRDGDLVRVEGVALEHAQIEGYRGMRMLLRFVDTEHDTLVVRKCEAVSSAR